MTGIFSSVISGMNAAQVGMKVTQHNITNVDTPGYSRQQVDLAARPGQQTGAGFIGKGVDTINVRRVYDELLNQQVLREQSENEYLKTYHQSMKQVDNLIADQVAGISPSMQEFFSSVNNVANDPASPTARQTMLSSAQAMISRFQGIDQRFSEMSEGVNQEIVDSVQNINSYARQIASLNQNIKFATATGNGSLPNDLMDQREHLLHELSKEIRVSVSQQRDGTASVFIGNGQSLVVNTEASTLTTHPSDSDPKKIEVAYQNRGATVALNQESLQGGNLGAQLEFRDQSLEPARNALGRVAIGLAHSFNQQHQLGQDLNERAGTDLFDVGDPQVIRNASNNTTAELSAVVSDVSQLTTSDYEVTYTGGAYVIERLSDNVKMTLGDTLPQEFDGFTLSEQSGFPEEGDQFLIRPTANSSRDLRLLINDTSRIAAAAPMRTENPVSNLGTARISAGAVEGAPPQDENIRHNVTIRFDSATSYTVTDNTTGEELAADVAYDPSAGATVNFNGWRAEISGDPARGDVFRVGPNTSAQGDNRNALLLADLQTDRLLVDGTATLQGVYGQFVGEIGSKTHELELNSEAQTNILQYTVDSQQSVAGVNLDEEAANLLKYQRAYQASAQALQISNTMFDTLLQSM